MLINWKGFDIMKNTFGCVIGLNLLLSVWLLILVSGNILILLGRNKAAIFVLM